MMDDPRISDEEARQIWRRAARLQGAEERAEARNRLAPGEDTATAHDPSAFHFALDFADGRAVIASIRAEGEGTRLRLRVPLYRRGLNLTLAGGSAGLVGGGGAAGGVALGDATAGLLGAASLAGAWSGAALGLLLGGGVGVWGYRKLYAGAVAKGDAAVRRLASAIATQAERDAT